MDLPHTMRKQLFDAGTDAVRFNSPLGRDRAAGLAAAIGRSSARSVVDLGCGRGVLAELVATSNPGISVTGIDLDERVILAARERSTGKPTLPHLSFETGDLTEWARPVDAAICIGASHAYGSSEAMFAELGELAPLRIAVIGDAFWRQQPNKWCRETFGPLPLGLAELAHDAEQAGWSVAEAHESSMNEWDEFEHGWVAGVRSVGTPEAAAFADEREREYLNYRGILGFGWLTLHR